MIEQNIFDSNYALDYGGGVSMFSSEQIAFINCTFLSNRANQGAAFSVRSVEVLEVEVNLVRHVTH